MPKQLTGLTGWLERRFYPDHKSDDDVFRERLEPHLSPHSVVLDAGCGRGLFCHGYRERVDHLVGCDVTPAIAENTFVDWVVLADLAALPFREGAFDVVLARYVLEHLTDPLAVFKEIARVLKPGGHFVALTPNASHYVPLVSRLTPQRFHEAVAGMRGNLSADTFPTCYRANGRRALTGLLSAAGLRVVDYCAYETRPSYLTFSPLAYAGIVYERLVSRFDALSGLRVSIIVTARKGDAVGSGSHIGAPPCPA